jgi:hypothetical protein
MDEVGELVPVGLLHRVSPSNNLEQGGARNPWWHRGPEAV